MKTRVARSFLNCVIVKRVDQARKLPEKLITIWLRRTVNSFGFTHPLITHEMRKSDLFHKKKQTSFRRLFVVDPSTFGVCVLYLCQQGIVDWLWGQLVKVNALWKPCEIITVGAQTNGSNLGWFTKIHTSVREATAQPTKAFWMESRRVKTILITITFLCKNCADPSSYNVNKGRTIIEFSRA